MRVIKPSVASVAAVASVYSWASATRYGGGSRGQGRQQGWGPFLKNLRLRRIAIPPVAHQGDAAILRHPQRQHSSLHIRPMVFGRAMGHGHGVRIALGDSVATAGKAGGGKMRKALRNAFLGTNG